jgi:hypothetical protein
MRPTTVPTVLAALAVMVAACGAAASPSPSPRPSPSPTPTPDPHLSDPADLQVVYGALQKAGLGISVTNASTSGAGKEPLRRVRASLGGWPLELFEYSSTVARETHLAYQPGATPVAGEPPYTFAGLNIAVTFGPEDRKAAPVSPDPRYVALAGELGEVLDTYLGPLAQRSVTPLGLPTPKPTIAPSAVPSGEPSPSPKAS